MSCIPLADVQFVVSAIHVLILIRVRDTGRERERGEGRGERGEGRGESGEGKYLSDNFIVAICPCSTHLMTMTTKSYDIIKKRKQKRKRSRRNK